MQQWCMQAMNAAHVCKPFARAVPTTSLLRSANQRCAFRVGLRKYSGQMLCVQSGTVFGEPAVGDDCITSGKHDTRQTCFPRFSDDCSVKMMMAC